jgi:hypothetical protein
MPCFPGQLSEETPKTQLPEDGYLVRDIEAQ